MSDDPSQIKIAALTALADLIVDLLTNEYDETEIRNAIEDVQLRFAWECDDYCLVYFMPAGNWCVGQIVDIVIDDTTNNEYQKRRKLMPIIMDQKCRCK